MRWDFSKEHGFAKIFRDNPLLTAEKVNGTVKIYAIELIDGLALKVGDPIVVGNYPQDNIFKFDVWNDEVKDPVDATKKIKRFFVRAITEEYAKTGIESFDRLNALRFPAEKIIKIWEQR